MQFIIVFACALAAASAGHLVAPIAYGAQHLPVIGANGVPVDTAEVQHATAAHLAHKVEAHARNGDFAVYGHAAYGHAAYDHAAYDHAAYAHATPVVSAYAAPVVSAYAHHAAPVVAAYAAQPAAYPTTAVLPQSVNGVPLETPEVVAAKSNHFAAHAEANARNGNVALFAPVVSAYAHAPLVSTYTHAAPVVASYAGHHHAAAYPTTAVLPQSVNGVPLETPEVVAAKANHFAAHVEANTRTAIHRYRRGVIASPLAYSAGYSAYASPLAYSGYSAYAAPAYATSYAHSPVVSHSATYHGNYNGLYRSAYATPFAHYY